MTTAANAPTTATTVYDDTIVGKVIKIVSENKHATPGKTIELGSLFVKDLNFDSLDEVEVVMDVEAEFNIEIPDAVAQNIRTVEDLVLLASGMPLPVREAEIATATTGNNPIAQQSESEIGLWRIREIFGGEFGIDPANITMQKTLRDFNLTHPFEVIQITSGAERVMSCTFAKGCDLTVLSNPDSTIRQVFESLDAAKTPNQKPKSAKSTAIDANVVLYTVPDIALSAAGVETCRHAHAKSIPVANLNHRQLVGYDAYLSVRFQETFGVELGAAKISVERKDPFTLSAAVLRKLVEQHRIMTQSH